MYIKILIPDPTPPVVKQHNCETSWNGENLTVKLVVSVYLLRWVMTLLTLRIMNASIVTDKQIHVYCNFLDFGTNSGTCTCTFYTQFIVPVQMAHCFGFHTDCTFIS